MISPEEKQRNRELIHKMADNNRDLTEARKQGDTARIQQLEQEKKDLQAEARRTIGREETRTQSQSQSQSQTKEDQNLQTAIIKKKKDDSGGGGMDNSVNRDPNKNQEQDQNQNQYQDRPSQANQGHTAYDNPDTLNQKAIARYRQEDIDRRMNEQEKKEGKRELDARETAAIKAYRERTH